MLQEYIVVKWHNKNKQVLEKNGYSFTNYGDDIIIETIHHHQVQIKKLLFGVIHVVKKI